MLNFKLFANLNFDLPLAFLPYKGAALNKSTVSLLIGEIRENNNGNI